MRHRGVVMACTKIHPARPAGAAVGRALDRLAVGCEVLSILALTWMWQ